jgi:hypothetical protein
LETKRVVEEARERAPTEEEAPHKPLRPPVTGDGDGGQRITDRRLDRRERERERSLKRG